MKSIVVREITSLVLRPPAPSTSSNTHIRFNDNTSSSAATPKKPKPQETRKETNVHARYYATITFNQTVLGPADREVALQLINVYFEMFKELLGEGNSRRTGEDARDDDGAKSEKGDWKSNGKGKDKGKERNGGRHGKVKAKEVKGEAGFAEVEDEHSKLISAILTGVNRALPFAKISSVDVGSVFAGIYPSVLFAESLFILFIGSANTSIPSSSSHIHPHSTSHSNPFCLFNK
jgi:ribosome biogenesis protein MAK21